MQGSRVNHDLDREDQTTLRRDLERDQCLPSVNTFTTIPSPLPLPSLTPTPQPLEDPMTPHSASHPTPWSTHLEQELRSDHAGETGAVYIYKGIVAVAKLKQSQELIDFAQRHGATEAEHLALIESVLAPHSRSRLLLAWRIAGWLTGALPALLGPRSTYGTIAAVETFVEQHYQQQIDHLQTSREHSELLELLLRCQADEIHHKDEARSLAPGGGSLLLKAWCWVVASGSAAAVSLARRL